MLQNRGPGASPKLLRLRHTDEWVGLLVTLSLVLFVAAIFEGGVLRRWLRPDATLRIVLPQTGFGGLAVGADVDVLGTHAGLVKQIILNPDGDMYAIADIQRQTDAFIRRDSKASIRLRYGVAGAAYVDITRGTGAEMDWNFAVLTATVEPNPTDTISATVNQIKADLLPTLEHASHAMSTLDDIISGIKAGQGTAGRLLTNDEMASQAEGAVTAMKAQIAGLTPILGQVAGLLNQSRGLLANLQAASRDASRATPQLPVITRNLADSTTNLPSLLIQTQVTVAAMEKLLTQLQGSWLLGGGGTPKPESMRLPPRDVQP